MQGSQSSSKITRPGGSWQIALVLVAGACRTNGPPAPIPAAAEGDPLWDGRDRPDIPQIRDAEALFDSLQPSMPIVLHGAVLVCRMDARENPATTDPFSDPDLAMSMTIGSKPERIVWGKNNTWHSTVSIASVDLVRGETVRIGVWDNDSWTNGEWIGKLEAKFDGSLPLILRNDALTVECRAMPRGELATRVSSALHDADRALDTLEATPEPNFLASSLELPKQQLAAARKAITITASYVGWKADDIAARVAREEKIERDWTQRVRARGDALVSELPTEAAPFANAHISGRFDCDAGDCFLHLDIALDEGKKLELWYSSGISARLMTRDGTRFATQELSAESNGRVLGNEWLTVENGEHLTVTLAVPEARDATLKPELAVVSMRKVAPVLIRVH